MSVAAATIDLQLDLIAWCRSEWGMKFLRGMEEIDNLPKDAMVSTCYNTLIIAEPYAVTEEIVDVLEAAAPSLPDFALEDRDLPTSAGFVYFDKCLVIHDSKDQPIVVRGMSWMQAATVRDTYTETFTVTDGEVPEDAEHRGIVISIWTDPDDERDISHESWVEIRDRMRTAGVPRPRLQPMFAGIWEFGAGIDDGGLSHELAEKNREKAIFTNRMRLIRLLGTFFRFVGETWIDDRAVLPDRPTQRRAARAKRVAQVRVVQLRKAANPVRREEHGTREYTHRFLVEGHWRNQWYPSQQRHMPRWINPYVKGPEDKPFIAKDRVFHVAR